MKKEKSIQYLAEIAEIGARYFNTTVKELSTEKRTRQTHDARAIISDYLVQKHKFSRSKAAQLFKRRQSSISKACKMARELPDYCDKFRAKKEAFWNYMLINEPGSKLVEKTIYESGKSHLPVRKITPIIISEPIFSY